jgi:hypothetical protein
MMTRNHTIMLGLVGSLSLVVTSCKEIECGDGTIERDGTCAPATTTTSAGMCGPFTELQGDRCVPMFPPTECDPGTTTPMVDPATGVTTCIGTGGGGCSAAFACPTPTMANRMTICGQLYDFETTGKFQGTDPSGTACDPSMPDTAGPCALNINAYDALMFASNPSTAVPLNKGGLYIDDCGRYRLTDIDTNGTGPFIGLGIDDAAGIGPTGVTVTVGVATPKSSNVITDFEGYIVKGSTIGLWQASGGPPLSGGIYAAAYRAHKLVPPMAGVPPVDRHAPQADVQFAKNGVALPADDHYFMPALTTHTTIDPSASVTGMNGTALVTNRAISESVAFDGLGGLGTGCRWEPHAAASLPGVVFIQIFRKADLIGQPGSCTD